MVRGIRRPQLLGVVVAGALALSVAVSAPPGDTTAAAALAAAPGEDRAEAADVVPLRPLTTSADRRIVDDLGRDVLLRGANVNSLGEYWQGVPELPTTIEVTEEDWDAMAAHGFSVVRLLITWSRVEPERDVIDQDYLDRVDSYVRAAAAHGIYTVIDMHQDAYSAFISTTDPAECPPGTSPARGWDGAPAWATLTDGLSTCLTGDRNSSPAVQRAWNSFYDDRDGIRTEFSEAWAAVAERFAGRPEVAGYDLLNEPDTSRPSAELTPIYEDLLRDTGLAIRAAEAGAAFDHILIVEPVLPAGVPANGLVIPDPGRVGIGTEGVIASVHNYSESISAPGFDFTIEGLNDLILSVTAGLGVATWGGEYGFFDLEPSTLEKVARYAADEDANLLGGAWWQWRQSCGDPHSVQWRDGEVVSPAGVQVHLNPTQCPDNTDLGPNDAFLDVLGRAYPRTTPGRLTSLTSDPVTGELAVSATAGAGDVGQQLVVWSPTVEDAAHRVTVEGLGDVVSTEVPGGRIITATVTEAGPYQLTIGVGDPTVPPVTTDPTVPPGTSVPTDPSQDPLSTGPSTAAPAVPVPVAARFTG